MKNARWRCSFHPCSATRYRHFTTNSTKPVVYVKRNIPYASHHPCNVMDMYESSLDDIHQADSSLSLHPRTKFLHVHGGMWMFGSKDHEVYSSLTDFFQGWVSRSFQQTSSKDHPSPFFQRAAFSNLGVTIARHGGQAFVINYRLVDSLIQSSSDKHPSAHRFQVMDVAHAISFLIRQEWEERQLLPPGSVKPNIFIGGFSAGAHLTALALAQSSCISRAMKELGLDPEKIRLEDYLAGFIGFSGPYNLKRLYQSPLADLTIGPALFGKGLPNVHQDPKNQPNMNSILEESSPIHVLLSSHPKDARSAYTNPPLLGKIPLLLINAEQDFHLSQDSQELLVALGQYPTRSTTERFHITIPSTHHLNLMKEFSTNHTQECEVMDQDSHSNDHEKNDHGYLNFNMVSQALDYYLRPQLNDPSVKPEISTTAQHVLEFIRRVTRKHNPSIT